MNDEKKQPILNTAHNMFAEERKRTIVDLVNQDIKVTVNNLCDVFHVSSATIRNDLRELEQAKLLKRTHGGAISNTKTSYELNAYQKEAKNVEEKKAIAQLALQHIQEGDTIALDTSTTTFELAKLLVSFEHLTVVTNDLQIAFFLEQYSRAGIIMAGGLIRRDFHCTAGQKALETLKDLNVDKAFIAANGISFKRGITTPNISNAEVKSKLISIADEVILLADNTKFGTSTFVKFADFEEIDLICTNCQLSAEYLDEFKKLEIPIEHN